MRSVKDDVDTRVYSRWRVQVGGQIGVQVWVRVWNRVQDLVREEVLDRVWVQVKRRFQNDRFEDEVR